LRCEGEENRGGCAGCAGGGEEKPACHSCTSVCSSGRPRAGILRPVFR
jgi:hypothetical protein